MSLDGLLLELIFALCAAGALLGIFIPDRRKPALLAWAGSLASLPALWVSGNVLWLGQVSRSELWTIRALGTLSVSFDRLSALFLLVVAVVALASSIYSAGCLKRYAGHYNLKALNAWYLLLHRQRLLGGGRDSREVQSGIFFARSPLVSRGHRLPGKGFEMQDDRR